LALDLSALTDVDGLVARLADKRVVFIGEVHDRFDHHLNQLDIIRGLHKIHPNLMVGLEFFQQPFQRFLDAYIAGDLDEKEMLRETEYYERWRYDFRLYAPILRFAREKGIRLVALNVPKEITSKVAREGLASLNDQERAQLPREIDRSQKAYRARVKAAFDQHPKDGHTGKEPEQFENFLSAQLLWDEGMAAQASQYLIQYPDSPMVILAGGGHIVYGDGIPARLARRLPVDIATVMNLTETSIRPGIADFVLLPQEKQLPPAGRLGVILEPDEEGMRVNSFSEGSAADAAGIERGDRILAINGNPISGMADVRAEMWDKRPGDLIPLVVLRKPQLSAEKRLDIQVELR
jgi:uncharacterized iron-regulated protein